MKCSAFVSNPWCEFKNLLILVSVAKAESPFEYGMLTLQCSSQKNLEQSSSKVLGYLVVPLMYF